MIAITVREFARLTTASIPEQTLDRAQVSASAFDWLCGLSAKFSSAGAALVEVEDRRWLKLANYVGVLETPCGTRFEILPKHHAEGDCTTKGRALLRRMIAAAMDLPVRDADEASLQIFDAPLSEWVMGRFLAALDHLIKRGLRSDYLRVAAAERYLRGQLDIVRQMRQPPGRQHVFQIRHDVFVQNRPENRLIKRALEQVCKQTQSPENWRLAQELRSLLQEIPVTEDVVSDFKRWRTDRMMTHYLPVRPWCELILYRQMPYSLAGDWRGISMLFPMEKLFERYVAAALKRDLASDARLVKQAASHYLCEQAGGQMFRLQPDLIVQHGARRWVLDSKWKRLNASNRADKYGLSQADFYQLFAYGQKYLAGQGEMVLIYPLHRTFDKALPVFDFGGGLTLWALPFDLDASCLVDGGLTGLPLRNASRTEYRVPIDHGGRVPAQC
jgi:5-methylcytosine-specific restriction enzyme subunit McrC